MGVPQDALAAVWRVRPAAIRVVMSAAFEIAVYEKQNALLLW